MFQPLPDDTNLVQQIVDEEHNLSIGIYPVVFGMRVRGGYADDDVGVHLDWCCGNDQKTLEWAYSAMRHILKKRAGTKHPFDKIPTSSEIKPITSDTKFIEKIGELIDTNFDIFTLPPIAELRKRYFSFHPKVALVLSMITGETHGN